MKRTVKKCECGRVSDPIHLSIVEDTWVKKGCVYYQFKCPQCLKTQVIKNIWDER